MGLDHPTSGRVWKSRGGSPVRRGPPNVEERPFLILCFSIFAQPDAIFNLDLSNYGDDAAGTPVKIWGRNEENKNQVWKLERGKKRSTLQELAANADDHSQLGKRDVVVSSNELKLLVAIFPLCKAYQLRQDAIHMKL